MKYPNIILLAAITALAGLGAGYLIFGKQGVTEENAAQGVATPQQEQIWTCAMHPQIRKNAPGKCPICGMTLIPLAEAVSEHPIALEMTDEAVKLANIETVEVGAGNQATAKTTLLTGKIQADEREVASQVAHVPGRIEQLFVTFTGERVRTGQPLASIYSPELVSAQRELIEAMKWKDTQPQLLAAARDKLRYWKIPDATIAQIEASGNIQPTLTVSAEYDG